MSYKNDDVQTLRTYLGQVILHLGILSGLLSQGNTFFSRKTNQVGQDLKQENFKAVSHKLTARS